LGNEGVGNSEMLAGLKALPVNSQVGGGQHVASRSNYVRRGR